MPIPESAFADVPELLGHITQPEDCRLRFSIEDLARIDDLARSQGREYPWRLSNEELATSHRETLAGRLGQDLWVFCYGSLIWDPGLNVVEIRRARAPGYRRKFCLTQTFDRGSLEHPGLMLALDRADGEHHCDALVMRIPSDAVEAETGFLWRREMIAGSYTPIFLSCDTVRGPVEALAFLVSPEAKRYVDWPLPRQAQQIAGASGGAGTNTAYLEDLVSHLNAVGIHDDELDQLLKIVREVGT